MRAFPCYTHHRPLSGRKRTAMRYKIDMIYPGRPRSEIDDFLEREVLPYEKEYTPEKDESRTLYRGNEQDIGFLAQNLPEGGLLVVKK